MWPPRARNESGMRLPKLVFSIAGAWLLLFLLPACGAVERSSEGSPDAASHDASPPPRHDAQAEDARADVRDGGRRDAATDGPSADDLLSELTVSQGMLSPLFSPDRTTFTTVIDPGAFAPTDTFTLTPTADDPDATITVNGVSVASGAASGPMTFSSWTNSVEIKVTAPSGASMTYTLAVVIPSAVSGGALVQAPAGAPGNFGFSVALSGDTLAVGAVGETPDPDAGVPPQSGAVYVFQLSGTTWTMAAELQASNARLGDEFGWSLALAGDTLVVGAPGESSDATGVGGDQSDTSASGAGAAYVFTGSGSGWTQTAYVKASNTAARSAFGQSVALTETSSGSFLMAIGAPNEASAATGIGGDQGNVSAPGAGAAYVFTNAGGGWSQQAYVKASNTSAAAEFGASVTLSGETLAVGAPNDLSGAQGVNGDGSVFPSSNYWTGAAYVFFSSDPGSSGGTWAQQAFIKESHPLPWPAWGTSGFGSSVALSGDALVVGAPSDMLIDCGEAPTSADDEFGSSSDGGAYVLLSAGSVYTYARSGSTWTFGNSVQAAAGSVQVPVGTFLDMSWAPWTPAESGYSVALSGDRFVTGGPGSYGSDGKSGPPAGPATTAVSGYALGSTGAWEQNSLFVPGTSADFGASIAISGNTVAAGGAWSPPPGTSSGVYVYTLP
jgi:hypothetical protein